MKNVILNHRTQGKGVEAVHIHGIAEGMRMCGLNVTIVSPPGIAVSRDEGKRGLMQIIAKKAPQFVFECLEFIHNGVALQRLLKERKTHGCDLLYERYAYLGVASAVASKLWKVPLVVEINYTSDSDLAVRSRSRLLTFLTKACERFIFKNATVLLPVSTKLGEELVALGYPQSKILVSPNAVDVSSFIMNQIRTDNVRERLFPKAQDVVIGFVGSFAPWHRVDLLIEASLSIAGSVDRNIGLLLVGEGENKERIRSQLSATPANLTVVFTGFVPHKILPEYIEAMDIAVMPHSNDYGSPMKVFEYMAMGKPVVAPDFGPLRDAIEDGSDGVLFSPGNIDELKALLRRLVMDPSMRAKIGANARTRVEEDHNWKNRCVCILDKIRKQETERV